MPDNLKHICEQAMIEGKKIDLTGCSYGETTGPCPFIKRPTNYYYFLSGFVRSLGLARILEIGTHFGGAIMSMRRGLSCSSNKGVKLVTVDITCKNKEGFESYPDIERVCGDSLDKNISKKVVDSFSNDPVDLVYIDSIHEYDHTMKNLNIYAGNLNPRYVILDDIRQCDSMKKLWSDLKTRFREDAFDASDISIRKGAGLGVIKWKNE